MNIINCIKYFNERSETYFLIDENNIKACILIFKSDYNDHIWHDPTIWIIGNNKYSKILLDKIKNKKFVMISLYDISKEIKIKFPGAKIFNENIMVRINEKVCDKDIQNVRRLSEEDAIQSLNLDKDATYNEDLNEIKNKIDREKKFINERICFGKFIDNKLIARGAIMSITDKYSSIGGFYTIETERRKGYISEIIKCILNGAKKHSLNSCLFVSNNNNNAIKAYEKLGFTSVNNAYFYDVNTGLSP